MSIGQVASATHIFPHEQLKPVIRMCIVRITGTNDYVGTNGEITTKIKAMRLTIAKAQASFPEGRYNGQEIKLEFFGTLT